MLSILLPLCLSFLITFFSIPVIIHIAREKKLYDVPDMRKVHTAPTSAFGGLGIFAGFAMALLVSLSFGNSSEFQFFLAAALVIFFLGLKDDILVLSPSKKFAGQLLAAFLVVQMGDIQIRSMHGFLGIGELPAPASLALTYFTVILVINSFNLIDGVDGLAGSLGLMVSGVLGIYFLLAEQASYAALAFALAGSLVAFLYFNFSPARIFMGDTGSLMIGLICAILVIKFIETAPVQQAFPIAASPALGFAVLMIPLLDTLRVFGNRISRGRSPFRPDRGHIHHILLRRGLSHRKITGLLAGFNLWVVALCLWAVPLGNTVLIPTTCVLFFGFVFLMSRPRKALKEHAAKTPVRPLQPAGGNAYQMIPLPEKLVAEEG